MIRFSNKEHAFIQKIHYLSGLPSEDIKEVWEAIVTQTIFNYMEDKPTSFPLIGEFNFKHIDDFISRGKKEAIIETEFVPCDFLKKIIGQIKDGEETEIEKLFKRKIRNSLEKIIIE